MLVPTFRMQILLSLLCSVYALMWEQQLLVWLWPERRRPWLVRTTMPRFGRGLPSEESALHSRNVCRAKGRGLFALKSFKTGEDVIEYRGALLSYKALAERYGFGTINLQGRYVFELRENGLYIDAGDEATSGRARFLNHSARQPNLRVETDLLHNRAWFSAIRDIAVDEELCFDYGERYWAGWQGELFE